MPFHTCLIILLAMGLWACQPAPSLPPEHPPQRQDILTINEQAHGGEEYWIEWGSTRIPLAKYANPEVYGGSVEIELEVFREMLDEKLQLIKRGKVLDIELVSIHRQPYRRFDPYWYSYPDFVRGRLGASIIASYRKGIGPGDRVSLSIHALSDSPIVQSAVIKISDPFEEYVPEVEVPRPRYLGDVFGFQVLQERGRRPLLRIDTAAAATRHIYELYKGNRLYKIIHIPGFKTRRRLLTKRDQLFTTKEVHRSELLGTGYDWLSIPEFTAFESANVRLEWGEMEAAPSSINYPIQEFRAHIQQPLRLLVGDRELPIRGFHLITASRERLPEMYTADSLRTPVIQKVLYKLPPSSTAYFDKLAVIDESGQLMLFPVAFAFNIGAERPFDLQITAAARPEAPASVQMNEEGVSAELRLYSIRLSAVLPLLLGPDSTRLRMERLDDDPILDIRYSSPNYTLVDGKLLLLRELQEKYRLDIDWQGGRKAYQLVQVDSFATSQYLEPGQGEYMEFLDRENKTALLVWADTDELATFLGRQLEVSILNKTGIPSSGKLKIHLDFSSLAAARKSLEHQGLGLKLEKEEATVIVRQKPFK